MSELDPALALARNFDGTRRFYPPGQHPATAQMRAYLRQLRRFADDDHEAVVYVLDRLACFEEGESQAKQLYLRRYVDR